MSITHLDFVLFLIHMTSIIFLLALSKIVAWDNNISNISEEELLYYFMVGLGSFPDWEGQPLLLLIISDVFSCRFLNPKNK